MPRRTVVIAVARCTHNRGDFGMRFEEAGRSTWELTWAFPLKSGTARREGYDRTQISGEFALAEGYRGCPYCMSMSFWKCGQCAALACWDGETSHVTCPTCSRTAEINARINQISAGGDR